MRTLGTDNLDGKCMTTKNEGDSVLNMRKESKKI